MYFLILRSNWRADKFSFVSFLRYLIVLNFLLGGSDILETNTYQASIQGFQKHLGLNDTESYNLIKQSVGICREAIKLEKQSGTSECWWVSLFAFSGWFINVLLNVFSRLISYSLFNICLINADAHLEANNYLHNTFLGKFFFSWISASIKRYFPTAIRHSNIQHENVVV